MFVYLLTKMLDIFVAFLEYDGGITGSLWQDGIARFNGRIMWYCKIIYNKISFCLFVDDQDVGYSGRFSGV